MLQDFVRTGAIQEYQQALTRYPEVKVVKYKNLLKFHTFERLRALLTSHNKCLHMVILLEGL